MVLPLVALFFGTGNQTASVPAALVARVFLDPEARLFDLDGERLLSTEPTMLAFPSLSHLYASLATASGAGIRCGRRVLSIERSPTRVLARAADGACAHFDQVIFACDAESALMVLGDDATTMERGVLGSVRYYDDLTVTHGDVDYMRRHYTLRRDPDHYLVRIDPTRREHIEMSFVLTAYQPQLANRDRPLFQTIFLDESRAAEWTRSEIARDAVVLEKRWRQFAHTWRHFAWTVPRGRLVQGRRRTRYAGPWTFMNTHEMATLSGIAAAAALGAPVPFADDPACARGFSLYRSVAYGR